MPVRHLTAKNVGSLPWTGGKKTEYWDDEVSGLVLRVYETGFRASYVVYKRHGRSRDYKLGDLDSFTLAAARQRARDVRARVQLGADPQSERLAARERSRQSVAAVCNLFLKEEGGSSPSNRRPSSHSHLRFK